MSSSSSSDCEDDVKGGGGGGGGIGRLIALAILSLLILLGVIALVLYLVYHPHHPRFAVVSVAVVSFANSTSPFNTVTAAVQPTLIVRNPNAHGRIRYDSVEMYVTYRDAPITAPVFLPPLTQARDSAVVVSPVLGGPPVPVSPDVVGGLIGDRAFGVVPLRVIAIGRIRYDVGPFHGQWRSLYVRCSLLVGARTGVTGPVPLISNPDCSMN